MGDPARRGKHAKRALLSLLIMLVVSANGSPGQPGAGPAERALGGLVSTLDAIAHVLQGIADLISAAH